MSIRHHKGYWTIFIGEQPVMSCVSFMAAWEQVYALSLERHAHRVSK